MPCVTICSRLESSAKSAAEPVTLMMTDGGFSSQLSRSKRITGSGSVSLDIQANLAGCFCFCRSRSWVNVTLPKVAGRPCPSDRQPPVLSLPEVLWCMRMFSALTGSDSRAFATEECASFTLAVMSPQISDDDLSRTAFDPFDKVRDKVLPFFASSSLRSESLWETCLPDMVVTALHARVPRRGDNLGVSRNRSPGGDRYSA